MVAMRRENASYAAALEATLRTTAAAYGYTLTIGMTIAALTGVRGTPRTGELFLFIAGGVAAFVALELVLHAIPAHDDKVAGPAFPLAGALNLVAVAAGLGAAVGLAHAVHSDLAWLLAAMCSTAIYMLIVALQVAFVDALRN